MQIKDEKLPKRRRPPTYKELLESERIARIKYRNALDKYPLAFAFASDIHDGTPAEIEAQAKHFHERMEKVVKEADEAKVPAKV
jgi:hypothetical protein